MGKTSVQIYLQYLITFHAGKQKGNTYVHHGENCSISIENIPEQTERKDRFLTKNNHLTKYQPLNNNGSQDIM